MSVACLLAVAVAAQERPLPEREAFLRETRTHLQSDSSLQGSYVYVETRREQKVDKRGRVLEESVKVFESIPGLPGESRWERQKFALRAWINESDHELVRLDAEAIDTLTMGLGVMVRLHKGSQLTFLRRKVNDEVWLPAAVHFRGGARVALVRTLRRSSTSEFSGYRRFSVDTATTDEPPATQ